MQALRGCTSVGCQMKFQTAILYGRKIALDNFAKGRFTSVNISLMPLFDDSSSRLVRGLRACSDIGSPPAPMRRSGWGASRIQLVTASLLRDAPRQ